MAFHYEDECEVWLRDIMENHEEEALSRVSALLGQTIKNEDGCWVSDTQTPRKVRFRGRQVAAYRLVYCVLNRAIVSEEVVVRHRCHNRRCMNPGHLVEGSRADNKRDDWDHWANGTDRNLL